MPIPLVKTDGQWRFDTAAGKEEIINRHIGKDELHAIGVCRAYVTAQRQYASLNPQTGGEAKYALKFKSAPGKKDGLYWASAENEPASPFGPLVAEAHAEGYASHKGSGPHPFHGYYFRILTRQGKDAPGGKMNYVSGGHLTGGFALVAYPEHWDQSGIMTFIVNQDGKIYQRNIGEKTSRIAGAMKEYNPDSEWTPVQEEGASAVSSRNDAKKKRRHTMGGGKITLPWMVMMLLAGAVLTGCQTPKAKPPSVGVARETRNNSYSLLHQLLDEQKDVSLLRFIKREHTDVKNLVARIASASGAGSKLLEDFAKHDSSINLDDLRLPVGETATRTAIASTKKKELLGQKGDQFELTLLLTQTEALSYAWHLAKVAGENEPQPERARALAGVSREMEQLYREVFVMLLSKEEPGGLRNNIENTPVNTPTAIARWG